MSSNPSTSHTGGSGSAGINGPCGACKFLRRKCVADCIFAPYFDSEQGAAHFAAVHKVFGASNVSKLLLNIPMNKRLDAVVTICYEAQARLRDPVYGCVAHLFALQQQVVNLQAELSYLQAHLATLEAPTPHPPTQSPAPSAGISITNLPLTSCFPDNYDLSVLFDPVMPTSSMSVQSSTRPVVSIQLSGGNAMGTPPQHGGVGSVVSDLHELARELLQKQDTGSRDNLTLQSRSSRGV